MAQSRPTTTTDGAKALAKTITGLDRRVRTLELREDPTGGGGGTSGRWAELQGRGWVAGASGFAQANLGGIWDQSSGGGFTSDGAETVTVPHGRYIVQWVFEFSFLFENPFAGFPSTYFGDGWTFWRGGVHGITNTVIDHTSNEAIYLAPITYVDYGGGDAGLIPYQNVPFVWYDEIESVPGNDQLSVGIRDFYKYFGPVADLSADLSISDLASADGTDGDHNLIIASIGD
jgi:hypothetical protein